MVTALDPNTALVLIDFQKAVMLYPLLTPASEILANTTKLIAAFRKVSLPIVVVMVKPVANTGVAIRRNTQQPSSVGFTADLLELVPEIETQPDDIFITKHTWGAFYETPLDEELKKRGITGIVLAGVATSRGVESTARAASERGYNIAFAQDAMTDMVASAHENSLNVIFPRLGEVGDTDAIIAILGQ
ncbi:isochorismatase family protein [Spirosoma sp. HMF4905]|uniref:Isochorismatase family protein n=1 Tax=Spirosoma arboris TaxID=2682092 RepID=A0A7K1SAB0_9BACT|nr:isochorismatase family protein [Spirosoma arboris]MVM30739.1 isochorismatase family protein [Spirosoma arboris]